MEVKIAVIRVKGENKLNDRVEYALQTLKLYRRHGCSIVPNSPSFLGMIKKEFSILRLIHQRKDLGEKGLKLPSKKEGPWDTGEKRSMRL